MKFKKNQTFFLKTPPPPTRHIKYKLTDFAPINKSIMAYKLH